MPRLHALQKHDVLSDPSACRSIYLASTLRHPVLHKAQASHLMHSQNQQECSVGSQSPAGMPKKSHMPQRLVWQ